MAQQDWKSRLGVVYSTNPDFQYETASEAEAETLMLQVHHSDKAVVGIYSYDIAVSKAHKATSMAREQNYPLRLTIEPEE